MKNRRASLVGLLVLFIIGASIACTSILGASCIEFAKGIYLTCQITVKALLAIFIISLVKLVTPYYKIGFTSKKLFSRYLVYSLIPLLFLVTTYGPIYKLPHHQYVIKVFANMFTTAVWEELYFRGFGLWLLKISNKKLNNRTIAPMAIIFGLLHMTNLIYGQPLYSVILQSARAATLGYLLFAIYLKTGNIILPIITHFLTNAIAALFTSFSLTPIVWGLIPFSISFFLSLIFFIVTGYFIIEKYTCTRLMDTD